MPKIEFSKDEKDAIVREVQLYFRDSLEREIERFDAEFLLQFFSERIGPYYYNRGLFDAQAHIAKRLEDVSENITDAIYELEMPTNAAR